MWSIFKRKQEPEVRIHREQQEPFHWTLDDGMYVCSECKWRTYRPHKFCPGCGRRLVFNEEGEKS